MKIFNNNYTCFVCNYFSYRT